MILLPRPNKLHSDQMMIPQEVLGHDRILCLYGPIYSMMGNGDVRIDAFGPIGICDGLVVLNKVSHDPIKLIIDSVGGVISDALVIYDTIKTIQSPVWTIGRGAKSAAVLLLAAGQPGHRYLYEHSRVMLHPPAMHLGVVDPQSGKTAMTELNKVLKQLAQILVDNGATRSLRKILEDMKREFWMSAEEAVDYGVADVVIRAKGDVSPLGNAP